ncbi:MAG: zf-TFIIB domain-containing protein [Planctomycetota bacterium]|nr:MAG: zf-TFIIB domain-containing protein [Planctomycetota bacterium]
MKCLNCSAEMFNNLVQTKKDQIAYDICEACGSLWLDAGELDKMAFRVEGSIEYCSRKKVQADSEKAKQCPRCDDTALDKVSFIGSDIVLDRCRNCGGFWLDGGELDLINRQLEQIMPVKGKGFSEFVNNVHLPYWYKRVRKKSADTDFKVDVPPIKRAQLKSETEYVCPACQANLNLYTVFRIQLEGCPRCKGIFLDKDELRKLKDKSTKDSWRTLRWIDDDVEVIGNANAMPSRRFCPKCEQVKMLSTSFGDSTILIDWCPKCNGAWLDRDEFNEIIDFLKARLNKISSSEMKSKLYQELKEIWTGPEDKISEILDATAAIYALMNITIFEHPTLYDRLILFSTTTPIR